MKSFSIIVGYIRRDCCEWPLFSTLNFKAATHSDLCFLLSFHGVKGEVLEQIGEIEWAQTEGMDPEIDN